ncbi:hypothetical protein K458DRAFT_426307 [Lentithecium fluviatile CBS 122367]|uniref:Dockerin type 1 n=1 Tax=Lentithecium fluviatile CBS 122367 TaxID=1168545 RepID=A0A6G1JKD5_9PLEO|nr:hypothetical protein K458DRAFT_426307 [Lentithecium fluviatile CBS 122367]
MLFLTTTALFFAQYALLAAALPPTRRQATAPAQYTANPKIGGGGSTFRESAHFRVYNTTSLSIADSTLKFLEAAHQCFVEELGWRTPGLSIKTGGVGKEVGPWYKLNVYAVPPSFMPGAAGQQGTDGNAGLAYLNVVHEYVGNAAVVVHEFGHAMHYSEENWVNQGRTGAWWEPIANFIADLYVATPTCEKAKSAAGLSTNGNTDINLQKVIGDSYQVIVDGMGDTANYYQSWPFLSYITNNPDNYSGLGKSILLDMIRKYKINSNDTPLHSLSNLLSGDVTIQKVVGRYWARMAFVDIGHAKAAAAFTAQRKNLKYANLDNNGNGKYTVKSARAPRYMGSNIIPLKTTASTVSVTITSSGTYTATFAVKGSSATRYVNLAGGTGSVTVASGEEVMLVIANTPALVQYDPFSISSDVNKGMSYSIQLTGATA